MKPIHVLRAVLYVISSLIASSVIMVAWLWYYMFKYNAQPDTDVQQEAKLLFVFAFMCFLIGAYVVSEKEPISHSNRVFLHDDCSGDLHE